MSASPSGRSVARNATLRNAALRTPDPYETAG
jgi:hypothetical protein